MKIEKNILCMSAEYYCEIYCLVCRALSQNRIEGNVKMDRKKEIIIQMVLQKKKKSTFQKSKEFCLLLYYHWVP